MPTNHTAGLIETSLAEGEILSDFVYLFDALMFLRRPYHEDIVRSEGVVRKIMCVITPDKPPKYTRAMREYRLGFAGVSTDPGLQAEFVNCVRHAALSLSDPEFVVWRPSLYFFRSRTLHLDLQEWF